MRQFMLSFARFVREFSRGIDTGHAIRHGLHPRPATGAALGRRRGDPRRHPSAEAVAASSLAASSVATSSYATASPAPPPAGLPHEVTAGATPAPEAADRTAEPSRPEPGTGTPEAQG